MNSTAATKYDTVVLLDVDNTLLDNDRIIDDLRQHLAREFGAVSGERYWAIFEALRQELGYADYLGALQRYRADVEANGAGDPRLLMVSTFLVDYPFADRLYPHALDVVAKLGTLGPTVIVSDGDVVFQPRKIQRSGLWHAVEGRVLIYVHKETMLDAIAELYPARRYVMVDDKQRLLTAMKAVWQERLFTVFPRQGHYATDPANLNHYPARRPRRGTHRRPARHRHRGSTRSACRRGRLGEIMNANTQKLHAMGQSLWIDNITRTMLADGTIQRYIDEFSITGLTSNPTIFEHAIGKGDAYDEQIGELAHGGNSGEDLFFALATKDLARAADLFRPIHRATNGIDGWVSLEVSPLLVDDAQKTIALAKRLHGAADRVNLYIKIPGTAAGVKAIEESIFAGVPVNVTLLFSREHYVAAAEAYLRGIERRIAAGLDPKVESVASLFVSRWDVALKDKVPRSAAEPARHRHFAAYLSRLSRAARVAAMGPARRRRRAPAAPALGQHRRQGPGRARHALRRGAGRARHGRHHARQDAQGVRRSWPARPGDGRDRRRRGEGDRRIPGRRHRRRRARNPAAGRRRGSRSRNRGTACSTASPARRSRWSEPRPSDADAIAHRPPGVAGAGGAP